MAKAQVEEFDEDEFEVEVEDGGVEAPMTSADTFEIDDGIEMGARQRNLLRPGKYPFDRLEVGQSFHVPATAEQPAPAKTLAGAVTNANNKWSHPDPSGETETRTVSVYELDANGKRVKAVGGGYIKTGEKVETRVKRIQDRHFTIRSVGANDVRGPGARVFRDL